MLDQEPIATMVFDAPTASASTSAPTVQQPSPTMLPNEMGPSFITGVDGAVVSSFLLKSVVDAASDDAKPAKFEP
jgi:nuclear RNA export factor